MEHLTKESFKTKVFDYETKAKWEYEGEKPCIIDFYADWCGPCKMLSPIIEEVSKEYNGKVDIYKVNTDNEQELAGLFGITSIPSILFVPMLKEPTITTGVIPKESFNKAIKELFDIDKE